MGALTRRRLLAGGAGLAGVVAAGLIGIESDLLPGRVRLLSALGLNGAPGVTPTGADSTVISGRFDSEARQTEVGWSIAYPAGHRPGDAVPVVVALHGRFADHAALFGDAIGLDRFLTADPSLPFAIAAADGGDTYWHRRRSGEDAGAMIIDEFLPLLARHGLLTDRIGLYGYSMGGYGALRLAGLLGPQRVSAVVAVSAALWTSAADTAPGAFDAAADFAATTVLGRQAELAGIPVRLDCGRVDSFRPAVDAYRRGFAADRRPAGGTQAGGHDQGYWRRMAPAELAFLAAHP